jgi:hypothetical protein
MGVAIETQNALTGCGAPQFGVTKCGRRPKAPLYTPKCFCTDFFFSFCDLRVYNKNSYMYSLQTLKQ